MCFLKKLRIKWLTKRLVVLQQNRLNHQVKDEAIKKECKIYHKLYNLYTKIHNKKRYPFALQMAIECLRIAAQINDIEAQFILGKLFLDEAKWREGLELQKLFSSVANQNLQQELYKQAHSYLSQADKDGHILAKRYLGLCYIFGWGTKIDKEKGLSMVVDSIAKANAWNKAPQIFAQLGLNKPEFYEAFMQQKGKS